LTTELEKKGLVIAPLNSKQKAAAIDLKDPTNKELQELQTKLSFIKKDLEELDQQLADGAANLIQAIQRNRTNQGD